GGNDTLIGEAGADTFDGGTGDDRMVEDSADTPSNTTMVLGRRGAKTLDFSAKTMGITSNNNGQTTNGFEYIYGSQGDDHLSNAGSSAFVLIFGIGGNDMLSGGEGSDDLDTLSLHDALPIYGGNATLIGGAGADTFDGGAGDD